jgi:hypothetical protein
MAYLYGELQGEELKKMEDYLASSKEAQEDLERFRQLRSMMAAVEDKEVIAPPLVIERDRRINFSPAAVRSLLGIAASVALILLIGYATDATLTIHDTEVRLSFGTPKVEVNESHSLTQLQVQEMINASLAETKSSLEENLQHTQEELDASIKTNLALNSARLDKLMKEASTSSQDQIRGYVATMQAENLRMVKDYFQLTSGEQRQYIEDLLVDFSRYLQEQRKSDLMVVQSRLNNIENNTDLFRQETEQILTSLISNTTETAIKN